MAEGLSKGQEEYERRRAAKAGMSLDRWLADKQRQQAAAAREAEKAREAAAPRKPGLIGRLLDRAHQPLGKKGEADGGGKRR